ncbi:hypothetical protein EKH80_20565 [Dyella choica]|uniref:Uncharacterized protein n=1 Tax=Dyella choica TaxID=1927959 RepID=A0A3S0S7B4_9GAMM|nr:hypothetical protein EKH80_20565 [Dyella choica]
MPPTTWLPVPMQNAWLEPAAATSPPLVPSCPGPPLTPLVPLPPAAPAVPVTEAMAVQPAAARAGVNDSARPNAAAQAIASARLRGSGVSDVLCVPPRGACASSEATCTVPVARFQTKR